MPWRFNPFTGNLDETDIPAFNGEVTLGSAASPSIFFTGDPNTGIYSPGADQLALSTNGTGRLFVDAGGRVLVGTSSARTVELPTAAAGLIPILAAEGVLGDNDNYPAFLLTRNSDNTSNFGPFITMARSRGNTLASNTLVGAEDSLGGIVFAGADGTDIRTKAATITAFVDGTPGTDAMPGRLVFSTTPSASATPQERLRITSAGLVGIGTSSPGAKLTVAQAATNADTDGIRIVDSGGATRANLYYRGSQVFEINSSSAPGGGDLETLRLSTAGNARLSITRDGKVGIGVTSPDSELHISKANTSTKLILERTNSATAKWSMSAGGGSLLFRDEASSNERLRIDSSGRLLVGTSSARNLGGVGNCQFTLEGTDYSSSSVAFVNNANSIQPAYLVLGKSRGGSVGSSTIVQNGDSIGQIVFAGADGTDVSTRAAEIKCAVDGTPGTNDMPGRLVFSVTADGAASPTEALRISSNRAITVSDGGNVVLGTTTGTKIGTTTTQKLGFYNATPVVQPAAVADATAATVITQLNDLLAKLRTLGIIAT